MAIGGCSGGTAGGVKITTHVIAIVGIINAAIGNRESHLFRYRVDHEVILRAFVIIVFFWLITDGATTWMESLYPSIPPYYIYFEVLSALSTTGLSFHVTEHLETGGKLILCALMYAGRLGPLTFLLFLLGKEKSTQLRYPRGEVLIG